MLIFRDLWGKKEKHLVTRCFFPTLARIKKICNCLGIYYCVFFINFYNAKIYSPSDVPL